ncbi:MAG: decaprenyl-phosphate phosphoribosyltransferase [Actinomycetia bacterium]|nr:decaprenyl-phosphate phosphoribosyltransferase [Actinomycetes bacterium]
MDLRSQASRQTTQDATPGNPVTGPDATVAPAAAAATPGIAAYIRLARPKQWLKNVLVVAAPGAAGVLSHGDALLKTGVAFVCFCLAASGTYYINDALDVEADRLHPKKRFRPIAAGIVPVRAAVVAGVLLLATAVALSFVARWELAAVIAGYLALTVAYSLWLKNEAVIDLAAVAAGFVLRMIAGGVAVGVPISFWFLIVAASGSLFMVTGKRHAELLELGDDAGGHRRSLDVYSLAFLNYVRAVASSVAILAYCLWAFEKSTPVGQPIWFQLSIVPFVIAVLRYALLLEQGKGGAPEELVLSDRALQIIGVAWVALFAIAVHGS